MKYMHIGGHDLRKVELISVILKTTRGNVMNNPIGILFDCIRLEKNRHP